MARSVNFDVNQPLMETGLESPVDEEGVHDSFNRLIAEQSMNGGLLEDMELQQLKEEGRDVVPYLSTPPRVLRGRQQGRREVEFVENERQLDPLVGERWSLATLKILSSMPSRTIGRNRGAIISQYYNKTMQLRRRKQSRPSIKTFSNAARPSIRGYGIEADTPDAWETESSKRDRLVNNLQNLSVGDRVRMLKGMPLSVGEKSELRKLALQKEEHVRSGRKLHCCSQLKYYIIIALRQSWYSWLSFLHSLQLWQYLLKRVGGRFGSGVLSYFLFVKMLVFYNFFLFLVTGAFMVLPQAVHPPDLPKGRQPFSGLDLLTGGGYFSDTVMYYGYYSNYTLHRSCRDEAEASLILQSNSTGLQCSSKLSYNMPLAYFFTIGVSFFITCIILVISMSKSFGKSFRIDKSYSILAIKAFTSWDFKVIKKTSVRLMSDNICTQLKELLAEVNHKHVRNTRCQTCWRFVVHGLAWTICIASITACVASIYYFSGYMHRNPHVNEASTLALPAVVSLMNLLLPGLFNLAAWMEDYNSPSVRTYIAISRNLLLKVSVLGILCYHWLGRVVVKESNSDVFECSESFVGQELYRFLLMDFIFTLLDTVFGEYLWRFFSEKVLKRRHKPVFDIARNVLELIYGQTLVWLGVLFAPLLPAVQLLKLFLLFYIKMSSVMFNCQAPRKPYRVSQMTTIFITLLCFPSFLGASVCVTYTMWSIAPSTSCGPFRGLRLMIQAGKLWVEELEKDNPNLSLLARAHSYLVEHPIFLFVGAGIFLIVIYFHSQVVDGQRKIITLLQEQIQNEGEDKKFLITRLQSIHERKRTPNRRLPSQDMPSTDI